MGESRVHVCLVDKRYIITADGVSPFNLRELWAYRELIYFLTWRDIRLRYQQTVIGFAWAILQPVTMTVVFSLFFGMLAKIPSGDIPYPLFSVVGLLSWALFANGVSGASNSLVQDANLLQKVYFPRLILPIASILNAVVDCAVGVLVFMGIFFYYGFMLEWRMLWAIPLLVMELLLVTGVSSWLAAINVEYRDVRFAVPFFIQAGLFASPVIYPSTFVPARFQVIYGLVNPMSGVIDGFRWALLGSKLPDNLLVAAITTIVVFITGIIYFHHRERLFADVV